MAKSRGYQQTRARRIPLVWIVAFFASCRVSVYLHGRLRSVLLAVKFGVNPISLGELEGEYLPVDTLLYFELDDDETDRRAFRANTKY